MSQHQFPAVLADGTQARVTVGWDRPLQGYFMLIERSGRTKGDEVFAYSNLDDKNLLNSFGLSPDLQYFEEKAKEFGIAIPRPVQQAVQQDGEVNTGNWQVGYDAQGCVLTYQ